MQTGSCATLSQGSSTSDGTRQLGSQLAPRGPRKRCRYTASVETTAYRNELRAVLGAASQRTRPLGWSRERLVYVLVRAVAEWIAPLTPVGTPDLRWKVVTSAGAKDPIPVGPHDN